MSISKRKKIYGVFGIAVLLLAVVLSFGVVQKGGCGGSGDENVDKDTRELNQSHNPVEGDHPTREDITIDDPITGDDLDTGEITFPDNWTYYVGGKFINSIIVSDLDNDGKQEVIAGNNNGNLYVLNADGSKRWEYHFGSHSSSCGVKPAVGNVTGDARKEVIATVYCLYDEDQSDPTLAVFSADPNCSGDQAHPLWSKHIEKIPQVVLADLDSNGLDEIIAVSNKNKELYLLGHHEIVWVNKDEGYHLSKSF